MIEQILRKIPDLKEWHSKEILKKIGNTSWLQAIFNVHEKRGKDINSCFYRRLAYDEILSNFLVLSHARKRIKKFKKKEKDFNNFLSKKITNNFNFLLTSDQEKCIEEINGDLKSDYKMFRILQGDVGTGKTIISLISAANVINSKFQVVLMAPTEILAKQHYDFAKKIFTSTNTNIDFLSGKSNENHKKKNSFTFNKR